MNKLIAIILFLVFAGTGCSLTHAHTPQGTPQPRLTTAPRPHAPEPQAAATEPPPAAEERYFLPTKLEIPAIRLSTSIETVRVLANGEMGVPADFDRVGLLYPAVLPGQRGNAAIAGHVDHKTGPAVFYHLKRLKPGDQVVVSDDDGHRLQFTVRSVEAFKTVEAPLERVFGAADTPRLNLITCTGKFNRKTREHAMRLVVFTELAENGR